MILLADAEAPGASAVIERIDANLADWNRAGNLQNFKLTLSLGIAEWQDGKTLDEMLDSADRKMYEQKETDAAQTLISMQAPAVSSSKTQ